MKRNTVKTGPAWKGWVLIMVLAVCCAAAIPVIAGESDPSEIPPVPTPGMVTMLDLGADKCIPCKMMAPVIKELKKAYAGRASIIFIDVWKHREQARRFGIRGIPTQIFYDQDGREVERHVGYLGKENIRQMFEKLGVPPAEKPAGDDDK